MGTKPVLVTGGCGFVGRHLTKTLIEKGVREIWIVDNLSTGKPPREWLGSSWKQRKNGDFCVFERGGTVINFVEADSLNFFYEQSLNRGSGFFPTHFSDIFHLASIVGGRALIEGDPIMVATDLGIDATFFLWLTRDPKRAERVLYASSSAAYPTKLQGVTGAQALAEHVIDFKGELGTPDMTYGWSKLTGEYLSRLAHERYGVHVACVRPFSGYGEDQDLTYPTPSIALRVARGDNPVEVWGSGEQGRDFVHIDDCVNAFFPILDRIHDGSGVNIGTGVLTTFKELVQIMLSVERRSADIRPLSDKPVGVLNRYSNPGLLTKEIGWGPKISLKEGLARVLAGARERLKGNPLPFCIE